jgi:uncharacterized protein
VLVGLISDTHGLIRAEALAALDGVEVILHAGDVGGHSVLRELGAIAPVHAVFGNTDDPIHGLPQRLDLSLGGLRLHVSHGHELGSPTPEKLIRHYTADIIIYGHTHTPLIETIGTTLIVNPGAAGPRRFNLQPSVALLTIEGGVAAATLTRLGG